MLFRSHYGVRALRSNSAGDDGGCSVVYKYLNFKLCAKVVILRMKLADD